MNKIKIAFFGSSTFSLDTLNLLLSDKDIEVKSIITMPPIAKNRGHKISNNVVQDFALKKGFDNNFIFTPKTLKKNEDLLNILKKQELDFIIVVAYGKIITKEIIDLPKYEILNLHPSSLPKYRGAAPIERAIENDEKELDICIMKVDIGLDTGDIAMRKKYIIDNTTSASDIIPEISILGSKLMLTTIKKCFNNEVSFTKQSEEGMIYAEKIDKKELFIDLQNCNLDARIVYNKIRAFNNCGCCYFLLEDQRIKILKASFEAGKYNFSGFNKQTGEIILNNGKIIPQILQKEGKKPITIKDFINGLK